MPRPYSRGVKKVNTDPSSNPLAWRRKRSRNDSLRGTMSQRRRRKSRKKRNIKRRSQGSKIRRRRRRRRIRRE